MLFISVAKKLNLCLFLFFPDATLARLLVGPCQTRRSGWERRALPMEEKLPDCLTLMLLALCEYHVPGVGKLHILPAEEGCPTEGMWLPQAFWGVWVVFFPPIRHDDLFIRAWWASKSKSGNDRQPCCWCDDFSQPSDPWPVQENPLPLLVSTTCKQGNGATVPTNLDFERWSEIIFNVINARLEFKLVV